MTDLGDVSTRLAPLRSDGIGLETLAKSTRPRRQMDQTHRFWASNRRYISSDHREVMEVSFGAKRLVNFLSFRVSRFPLHLKVEYRDANGDWQAVTYAKTLPRKRGRVREVHKQPVGLSISESIPGKVDSAQAKNHPQHFGRGHWLDESWKVMPIQTSKIRFIFTRNHHGSPPRNHHGRKVPYSVALRDLKIGYRVLTPNDVPKTRKKKWWAASKDILGSQVVYSTYTQPAEKAVDGSRETYWRSEPQPFPFAVVNMFLDVRSLDGTSPVLDRFWVDPITTGVMCNVYHCDTQPEGDFEGDDAPIPQQFRTEVGTPESDIDGPTQTPYALRLGPDTQAGIEISNVSTRIHYSQPWWVGVEARSLVDPALATNHPLISMGSTQILQDGTDLKVSCLNGQEAVLPLPEGLHRLNSRFTLVVAYHPYDEATHRDSHFRISYRLEGYEPIVVEQAVSPLTDSSAPIRVGLHPDPSNTDVSAFAIHGLVVKSEALVEETEDWFHDEAALYVLDAENVFEERGTNYNARLRMHPAYLDDANLFGVVGGSGNRFDEMEWTPVLRDFTLKQGYMHIPPTKAGYWKFEMTGLLPQVYENFLTINQEALVFPPDVVAAHRAASGAADDSSAPSGVNAAGSMAQTVAYSDALEALRQSPAPKDATQVLVVKDPQQAAQIAKTGWIWSYQPWHVGSSAPQFIGTRQHRYESVLVNHTTKVAFFAGIREIQPFRVDYTFDDDTPEYVEHLLDTAFLDLDLTTGIEHFVGGVRSISSGAEIVSKTLMSYRTVRGVQFATQETDFVQVLTDPTLLSDGLFWEAYGDATLESHPGDVVVHRGWFSRSYGDIEALYPTYGDMDGVPYALLEGNNQPSGYAEGGVVSEPYTPSGAGEISGIVKISAEGELGSPVIVELVSAYDGRVAASGSAWIQSGETAQIRVDYAPGGLTERRTYGEVETLASDPTTYGQLEEFRNYEIETETGINTDLYLRVRQQGRTDDTFHVHRMGLYDAAVAWFFSNDDGATWWQAIKVRNDPHAVLIFPEAEEPVMPGFGRMLRWKAVVLRADATINALHLRPWYGNRSRTVERSHGLDALGPNRSLRDLNPATHQHPMWQERFNPIEHEYTPPPEIPAFWRNLVPNSGNEGTYNPWTATGGTVVVQYVPGEGA